MLKSIEVPIKGGGFNVGVAWDDAFCFYYEDNFRLLSDAGATLVRFYPIHDATLVDVDALYLGGGYPELHAARLEGNETMRAAVRDFCASGRLVWAECGGLMYLSEAIETDGLEEEPAVGVGNALGENGAPASFAMCCVLPFQVAMGARMTMGYCTAAMSNATAALLRLPEGTPLRSQQFHYSEAVLDGRPAVSLDEYGVGLGIPTVGRPAYEVC